MQALKAIQEHEETPLTLALQSKDNGNQHYKRGRKGYSNAIGFWCQGMEYCEKATGGDVTEELVEVHSVLYSNRAALHLTAKNYGECLKDAKQAIKINPKNIKEHFHVIIPMQCDAKHASIIIRKEYSFQFQFIH